MFGSCLFDILAFPNWILNYINAVWIYYGKFYKLPKNFNVAFFGVLLYFLNIFNAYVTWFISIILMPISK